MPARLHRPCFVAVLLLALGGPALPDPAPGLGLSLELESPEVPLYGAACGVLTFTNDEAASVEVDYPSVLRQTLGFELDGGDGGLRELRADGGASLGGGGRVTLAPGQSMRIPFYVLKDDRGFVFAREGEHRFRAVARVREEGGAWREIPTDWATLTVREHPSSLAWRRTFAFKSAVLMPFSLHTSEARLRPFRGTPFYRRYCIYQCDGLDLLRRLDAGEDVSGRLDEIARQAQGSRVGGAMWTSLLRGAYSLSVTELQDGDYYLGL